MQMEKEGANLTIKLADELSIYTANECRDLIVENLKDVKNLVIDLADVTELDSSGLQLLLALNSSLAPFKTEFLNHSAAVMEVFELCGLTEKLGHSVVITAEDSA